MKIRIPGQPFQLLLAPPERRGEIVRLPASCMRLMGLRVYAKPGGTSVIIKYRHLCSGLCFLRGSRFGMGFRDFSMSLLVPLPANST